LKTRLLFLSFFLFCPFVRAGISDISLFPPEISDSMALELARTYLNERLETCADLPGAVAPENAYAKGTCTHPLDKYVTRRDDSILIGEGGKSTLVAYFDFRSVAPSLRKFKVNHGEFLAIIAEPREQKEPWLKSQLDKILGWTFNRLLRFLVPLINHLWSASPGPVRIIVIVCSALLLLFFLMIIGRSLMYSSLVQRGFEAGSRPSIAGSTPIRWIDRADEEIQSGNFRAALTSLYCWLVVWVADHNCVRRHEWWTNHQLISAIKKKNHSIAKLAGEIVSRYENTEYGHRSVESTAIVSLFGQTKDYIARGRP
jgi:hypothetical protein